MNDSLVHFRLARAADVPVLRGFIAAFNGEDGHDIAPDVLERSLAAVAEREPLLRVWMIEREGRALGYVALALGYSIEVGGLDAFVDELYLLPEERAHGLGSAALAFVEREARALGVRRLCLEVELHNLRAHALYERHGYTAHSRHLMSKRLT